jgi:multicomponent Na+:H+ antiporter subunit D
MITLFFSILLLISFFSMSVYSIFHKKLDLIFLLILTISVLILINLTWYSSLISILFLITPVLFLKRVTFVQLMYFSVFGSILMAYFLLQYFLIVEVPFMFIIAILSVLLLCVLAIMGIFEDDLKKYLIYSNVIQLTFVLLDLSIAKLGQKISTLGTVQIFNYMIAGLLFFITLGILSRDNKSKSVSRLNGSYYGDKLNGGFAIISALSLAGLPGLNIFVSEWFLFKAAFAINPIITVFGIFAALLLFIMYFKIVNVLLIGETEIRMRSKNWLTYMNGIFAILCLIFGLIPQIQLFILNMVL